MPVLTAVGGIIIVVIVVGVVFVWMARFIEREDNAS